MLGRLNQLLERALSDVVEGTEAVEPPPAEAKAEAPEGKGGEKP